MIKEDDIQKGGSSFLSMTTLLAGMQNSVLVLNLQRLDGRLMRI